MDTNINDIIDKISGKEFENLSIDIKNSIIESIKTNEEMYRKIQALFEDKTNTSDDIAINLVQLSSESTTSTPKTDNKETIQQKEINDTLKMLLKTSLQNNDGDVNLSIKEVISDFKDELMNIENEKSRIQQEIEIETNQEQIDILNKQLQNIDKHSLFLNSIMENSNNNMGGLEKSLQNTYKEIKKDMYNDKRFPTLFKLVDTSNKKIQDSWEKFTNTVVGEFLYTSFKPIVDWGKNFVNSILPAEIGELFQLTSGLFSASKNFLFGDSKKDKTNNDMLGVLNNIKESFSKLIEESEAEEAMRKLAEKGVKPGSIFTRDINLEKILENMLTVDEELLGIEEEKERRERREGKPQGFFAKFLGIFAFAVGIIVGGVVTFIQNVLGKAIITKIGTLLAPLGKAIMTAFKPIITLFSKITTIPGFSYITKFFTYLQKILVPAFKSGFAIGSKIGAVLGKIFLPFMVLLSLWEFWKGFAGTDGNFAEKIIGGIKGIFDMFIELPVKIIGWLIEKVLSFFGVEVDGIADSIMGILHSIIDYITFPFIQLYKLITGEISIKDFANNMINHLLKPFKWLFNYVKNIIPNIIDNIKNFFTSEDDSESFIKSSLKHIIKLLLWPITTITNFIKGFTETEGSIIDKIWGGVKSVFDSLFGFPLKVISGLWSKIKNIVTGSEIGKKLINALGNMFAGLIPSWIPGSGKLKKWIGEKFGVAVDTTEESIEEYTAKQKEKDTEKIVKQKEKDIKDIEKQREKELKDNNKEFNNTNDKLQELINLQAKADAGERGFGWNSNQENADKLREELIKSGVLSKDQKIEDAMNDLIIRRDTKSEEINTVANQKIEQTELKANEDISSLAEKALEPGSIYTHDIRLVDIMKRLFTQSTDLTTGGHFVNDYVGNTLLHDISEYAKEIARDIKILMLHTIGSLSSNDLKQLRENFQDDVGHIVEETSKHTYTEDGERIEKPVEEKPFFSVDKLNHMLGSITALGESGNKGSMAIGWDKAGGTSYGKYQIAAKTGTMNKFLKHLEEVDPEAAAELRSAGPLETGGRSGAAVDVWKKLASEGRVQEAEHNFIKATHFDPAMKKASELGFDVNDPRIQEMVWSGSVQHGGINKILTTTAGNLKEGASIDDVVDQFYKDREEYALRFAPENTHKGIVNRYQREAEMIKQLKPDDNVQLASVSDSVGDSVSAGVGRGENVRGEFMGTEYYSDDPELTEKMIGKFHDLHNKSQDTSVSAIPSMETQIEEKQIMAENNRSNMLNNGFTSIGSAISNIKMTDGGGNSKSDEGSDNYHHTSHESSHPSDDIPTEIENIGLLFFNKTWGLA